MIFVVGSSAVRAPSSKHRHKHPVQGPFRRMMKWKVYHGDSRKYRNAGPIALNT